MSRPGYRLLWMSASRQLAAAGEVGSSHGPSTTDDDNEVTNYIIDDDDAGIYSAVTCSTWCVDLNCCLDSKYQIIKMQHYSTCRKQTDVIWLHFILSSELSQCGCSYLVCPNSEVSTSRFCILCKYAVHHAENLLHDGILAQVILTLHNTQFPCHWCSSTKYIHCNGLGLQHLQTLIVL